MALTYQEIVKQAQAKGFTPEQIQKKASTLSAFATPKPVVTPTDAQNTTVKQDPSFPGKAGTTPNYLLDTQATVPTSQTKQFPPNITGNIPGPKAPITPAIPTQPTQPTSSITGTSYDIFGESAKQMNMKTPGFLDQRNTLYAQDLSKQFGTQANEQQIRSYLQGKGDFASTDPTDQANTIKEIQRRLTGLQQTAAPSPTTVPSLQDQLKGFNALGKAGYTEDKAFQNFQTEMGKLDANYLNQLKGGYQNVINQRAQFSQEKDKYQNFDQIAQTADKASAEFAKMRYNTWKQGGDVSQEATPEEVNQISASTGIPADQVKKTLDGSIRQDLQLSELGQKTVGADYNNFVQDQTTALNRAKEDSNTKMEQLKQSVDWQIQDVTQQMERTVGALTKAGSLSGQVQSSGYMQGLTNIKDDAIKTIGRLQTQLKQAQEADEKDKQRLMDDFNNNLTRAKTSFDEQMKGIKTNMGVQYTTAVSDYGWGSQNLTKALELLHNNLGTESNQAFNTYLTAVKGAKDMLTYDTEKMIQIDSAKADLRQKQQEVVFGKDGQNLLSQTISGINDLVKQGVIGPEQLTLARNNMIAMTQATLSQMGTLTQQDVQRIQTAIDSGKSPQQVISELVQQNPTRFQNYDLAKQQLGIQGMQQSISDQTMKAQGTYGVGTPAQSLTGDVERTVAPTGTLTPIQIGGKTVSLDTNASSSIAQAFQDPIMEGIVVGQGHRDQIKTIETMANRYGIQFNTNDPAETARKLRDAGHQVADPGYSKHETGMAIDLYGKDGKAPSTAQVNILNSNGRYQTGGAGDSGHFEYVGPQEGKMAVGETSNSILAQTGLDVTAFNYLTQGQSALTRMPAPQQAKIKKQATEFLNSQGIDYSTFQSRYKALNESLQRSTKIMSNVQRDEVEIQGTLQNLMESADKAKFGAMKKANILKMFAGEEFNDPNVSEYQFQLLQLQEEIAGYNAALRGDTSPVESDSKRAAEVVASGVSSGGLEGLKASMEKSVLKMGQNIPKSIDKINEQVRDLFGVGKNFKGSNKTTETKTTSTGTTGTLLDFTKGTSR